MKDDYRISIANVDNLTLSREGAIEEDRSWLPDEELNSSHVKVACGYVTCRDDC